MMRPHNSLVADQKSVWYPVERFQRRSEGDHLSRLEGIYATTFPRDVSLYIMPIGGRSRNRKDFKILLEPEDTEFEEILANSLVERHHGYAHRLTEAVCDFFQHCAARIIDGGRAVYEIVSLTEPTSGELKSFELVSIDVQTLRSDRGIIFQVVPLEWAEKHSLPETIPFEADRLVVFSCPAFPNLTEIKESLAHLGGTKMFRMYSTVRESTDSSYDIKDHIRAETLAFAAATRPIGWNGGQTLTDVFLEYYTLHRRLIFQRFVISLREAILNTLNEALHRIGPRFGTDAKLVISGLPMLQDVETAMRELAAGERGFNSVIEDFRVL
jgi:hypothetical protein